jgi:signal peptidase I
MDIVNSQVMELKKLWKNKRQLTFQALNLAMIVFSALMIWKGLMFVTKSESPVVVVLRLVQLATNQSCNPGIYSNELIS